jgi:hypothetical protein
VQLLWDLSSSPVATPQVDGLQELSPARSSSPTVSRGRLEEHRTRTPFGTPHGATGGNGRRSSDAGRRFANVCRKLFK